MAMPSQCPSSGILHLKAGEYHANVSLGNCTVVGEAPGAVVRGKVTFDHGLLMGTIHFEGEGATSSCVAGSVEVNGDDVRFHGCDNSVHHACFEAGNCVNVSGGRARFEHGGNLCGLTIVAGSVNITNISGCDWWSSYLTVGPGPVNLNMADVKHYHAVSIDGMKGRLGGTMNTEQAVIIKNSVVEFDTFRPEIAYSSAPFSLDNVIGSGKVEYFARDHNYAPISNCRFNDMVYSANLQRGGGQISNTTWRGGSFNITWGGPLGGMGLGIADSNFQNVSVGGAFPGPTEITSSYVSGQIGLHTEAWSNPGTLTITKSYVVFLPAQSSSVAGPIRISSSILSFPGSAGALVGASHLNVTMSTIQVANVMNGSPIQIGGDIHMSDANIDVTNCSASWVSQSFATTKQIFV
jgi:hypothetical protein